MHIMIVPPSFVFKIQEKKETRITRFLYEQQVWGNIANFKERETVFGHLHQIIHTLFIDIWVGMKTLTKTAPGAGWGFTFTWQQPFSLQRCVVGLFLRHRPSASIFASPLTGDQWLEFCQLAGSVIFSSQDNRINPCYTHAAKYVGLFEFSFCFMWKENPGHKPRQCKIYRGSFLAAACYWLSWDDSTDCWQHLQRGVK